jgi:dGTPase
MAGHAADDLRLAHAEAGAPVGSIEPRGRTEREADDLAPGATRAVGAGNRAIAEEPDPNRTCFERDRDRILHSTAFRRLAGKTQVFVFPDDHQRTRLTHALEVAQVARSVADAIGLNTTLTEAIAIGHDCGHGPGGHASEDALSPYVAEGFDHAPWGADVTLTSLNLCAQTLDGIRNHSWSRPAPTTPEGEVVSWADRIAYVCHDFEDAVAAGIVTVDMLPAAVGDRLGTTRSGQLGMLVRAMIRATADTGRVGMTAPEAEAARVPEPCSGCVPRAHTRRRPWSPSCRSRSPVWLAGERSRRCRNWHPGPARQCRRKARRGAPPGDPRRRRLTR